MNISLIKEAPPKTKHITLTVHSILYIFSTSPGHKRAVESVEYRQPQAQRDCMYLERGSDSSTHTVAVWSYSPRATDMPVLWSGEVCNST